MNGRDSSFYEGEAGRQYQHAVHGDALESPSVFKAKSKLAAYRYFRDVPTDARIVEFGVGVGTNLASIPNPVRHGYDLGEFARNTSRERGIVVFDDPEDIPGGSYDLVICRHVLEHVDNPMETLVRMRNLLDKDGTLLLIIPIERTSRYLRVLPAPDTNNHLYAWGTQHIVNLLSAARLSPVRHKIFWYSMQARLRRLSSVPPIYSAAVTGAGLLRRQRELAIWSNAIR